MSCTDQIWRLTFPDVTIQIIRLKSNFMTRVLATSQLGYVIF
jgi:hypothetical protein